MDKRAKITTGANDRPRNSSIAQTAPGLPDDTSRPVEISDEEVERVARKLKANIRKEGEGKNDGAQQPGRG
jgi:hypothetical protein